MKPAAKSTEPIPLAMTSLYDMAAIIFYELPGKLFIFVRERHFSSFFKYLSKIINYSSQTLLTTLSYSMIIFTDTIGNLTLRGKHNLILLNIICIKL